MATLASSSLSTSYIPASSPFYKDEATNMIVSDIERDMHLPSFSEQARSIYATVIQGNVPEEAYVTLALQDLTAKVKRVEERRVREMVTVEAQYKSNFEGVKITEAMARESAKKIKRMLIVNDILYVTDQFWDAAIQQMNGDESQLCNVHQLGYVTSRICSDKEFSDAYSHKKEEAFLKAILRQLGQKTQVTAKEAIA